MSLVIIERLYEDHRLLYQKLIDATEVSLASAVDDIFRKALLLAAASYFEHEICSAILDYVSEKANADKAIMSLTKSKVVSRQYHTYFEWESPNANKFFSLFGEEYKQYVKAIIDNDADLQESIRAFLEIGNLRNQLVHLDYATFQLNKTGDEIYQLYNKAKGFIEFVPRSLRNFGGDKGRI